MTFRFNEAWAICRVVDKKDTWMDLAKSALEHLEIELGVYSSYYEYVIKPEINSSDESVRIETLILCNQ